MTYKNKRYAFIFICVVTIICLNYIGYTKNITSQTNIAENKQYQNLYNDEKVEIVIKNMMELEQYNYSYIKLHPIVDVYEDSNYLYDYVALQTDSKQISPYLRLFKVYKKDPSKYLGNNTWILGYIDMDLNISIIGENCLG